MSIEIKPASDATNAAFDKWKLLFRLIRKSEAMISVAISRVERANRLRAEAPKVTIGKQAAFLAKATEYEAQAHAHLAILPEFHQYLKDELAKVEKQIAGGLDNV